MLALLRPLAASDRDKDGDIRVLRHQVTALHRQLGALHALPSRALFQWSVWRVAMVVGVWETTSRAEERCWMGACSCGYWHNYSRSVRSLKKAAMSRLSRPGTSAAGKWPPLGMGVHRRML